MENQGRNEENLKFSRMMTAATGFGFFLILILIFVANYFK
jgi:hypothetical protein